MKRVGPGSLGAIPERTLALLVFLLTLAAAVYIQKSSLPLLFMGGMADEWFPLGLNLAAYGTLGWGNDPILLRPPGYPAFIAAVLRATTSVPAPITESYGRVSIDMVVLAQGVLLAATAALLFAWLRGRVGVPLALAAGVLYGLNPYCLVLPGLMHYDLLHLFMLVAGCAALDSALTRTHRTLVPLAAAGALWGLVALVRPVTLPMPLFVLAMLLARGLRGRRAAPAVLAFSLAMVAVIAPWTARNYKLTGRLIPINVQGWAAVWGSTVMPFTADPDEYHWIRVALDHYYPLHTRVTGEEKYTYLGYVKHNMEIEAELKKEAFANLRRQPQIYLWNVARAFLSMNLQMNTSIVSVFQRTQQTRKSVDPWTSFASGAQAERPETLTSRATGALIALLTVLAGVGIVRGLMRRDAFLAVPGLVYLCLTLAHTVTYFDYNYYYLKLPFLVVFAMLGAESLGVLGRRITTGLVGLCLAATIGLLLST